MVIFALVDRVYSVDAFCKIAGSPSNFVSVYVFVFPLPVLMFILAYNMPVDILSGTKRVTQILV